MPQRYDAVVIGGGHNGLISGAYLARGGLRTLVLERREMLGGATLTQEVFPGFRFSVVSYVVSLLRPEIIRDLQLPRHGLHILPLDGTFTPVDGDHLWRTDDHAHTMRELRRWSISDAEAYEEYGQLMAQMARFIKPILAMTPTDPRRPDPRDAAALGALVKDFAAAAAPAAADLHPAHDDERGRVPRPLVRDGPAEGHDERVGHHRHLPRRALAGHRLRAAAPLHGRDRRRLPRLGHPQGRHRRRGRGHRQRGARAGHRDPHRCAGGRDHGHGTAAPPAWCSRAARRSRPTTCSPAPTRGGTFLGLLPAGTLPPDFEAEVRRFRFRGSSGKVNLALDGLPSFTSLPGPGEHLRGAMSFSPSIDYMETAYDDAKAGRFSRKPLHRHRSSRRWSTRPWRRPASTS